MTTTNQDIPSPPTADEVAVEVTLSAERVSIDTVRTAVEVVSVARRIVTETVQVPVQIRHEELVLTSSPATDAAGSGTAGSGDLPVTAVVLVLHREVPVVALEVRATERVTVRVTTVTDQQTVTTDLRREQAEITTAGDLSSPDNTPDPT